MTHAGWQPKPLPPRRRTGHRPGPGVRTLLWRGLTKRCPACGRGHLFRRWLQIAERCPSCGLRFERIEGHWIGSIGMNTIITFGSLLVFIAVASVAFWDRVESPLPIVVAAAVFALLVPPIIDPFTRTLWTAFDVAMRPLEPHEVDWTVVDPAAVGASRHPGKGRDDDPVPPPGRSEQADP